MKRKISRRFKPLMYWVARHHNDGPQALIGTLSGGPPIIYKHERESPTTCPMIPVLIADARYYKVVPRDNPIRESQFRNRRKQCPI